MKKRFYINPLVKFFIIIVFISLNAFLALGSGINVQENAFKISPDLNSPHGQYNPRVAFDGIDTYLVVWEEGSGYWQSGYKQIYGARVQVIDQNVNILDPEGIHLFSTNNNQKLPKVVYGNGAFFVVWQELFSSSDYDLRGIRITSSGQILDSQSIEISSEAYNQINPDIAYDEANDRFFLVWADFRNNLNYRIYGARVGNDGNVIDTNGIRLDSEIYDSLNLFSPAVGINGDSLVAAWSKKAANGYLYYMDSKMFNLDVEHIKDILDRESTGGIYVGDLRGSADYQPGIISDGSDFLMIYRPVLTSRGLFSYLLGAIDVSSDGDISNASSPLPLDICNHAFSASGVYADPYYIVFYESLESPDFREDEVNHNIYATRVNQDVDIALDYENRIIISNTSGTESKPAAAAGSSEILVVYEEDNLEEYPIIEHVLKGKVVSLGEIEISYECNDTIDNDRDGDVDLDDGGCDSLTDDDETDCGDARCEGGEVCGTTDNFPECNSDCGNCPSQCNSGADNNPENGVVSIQEVIDFIDEWKTGSITINQVIEAIGEWKSGC